MKNNTVWALSVILVLLFLTFVEGYRPAPIVNVNVPTNVQDTITGAYKNTCNV
jgi:hypothetical protein